MASCIIGRQKYKPSMAGSELEGPSAEKSPTMFRDPESISSISILWGYPYLIILGFILREFIWDIPILSFAYVLFWGTICEM